MDALESQTLCLIAGFGEGSHATNLAPTWKHELLIPNKPLRHQQCGSLFWALADPRKAAPCLILGLLPLEHPHANRSVLPGKAPAAVQLLTPQLALQGITPSCRSSPPCRELLPFLLAAFSQVRAALNHLAFIHLQVAGKSLAPPPASGDGKTESYLPIQGPLIPGQSPAEKAKRKHAVLLWCVGGWREHAK